MSAPALTPAVFLDRDGTLMEDVDYCGDPRDVSVFPDAAQALAKLKRAGFKLIVITNQSGIARGFFTEQQFHGVQQELHRQLGADVIDAVYFAPDLPGKNAPRRKPRPGMVLEAAREHALDLSKSFFIGDKKSDVECARAAGVRSILVRTGYGAADCNPDFTAADLVEAAEIILRDG
jgi:D-glycero-D-manno-heptose 1,7-bisphosphate phosphatase